MPNASTRHVEQYLRELATLYRKLADYLENGSVLLREIRVKTQDLRRAFGQADTLMELAWMQGGKMSHRHTPGATRKPRRHSPAKKPPNE